MSESDLVLLPELFEFVSAVGANRDETLDPPGIGRLVSHHKLGPKDGRCAVAGSLWQNVSR
jgi:hypothetical protein